MVLKPRERYLVVAVILGIVAAAMVYSFLSSRGEQAQAEAQVVTAASFIPNGVELTAEKLQIRSFPRNLVPPGAAVSTDMVIGKIAKTNIQAGKPISMSSIGSKDRLSYVVPPGMRAVTVAIDPVTGVGGFLKPDDCVDVVASFEVDGGSYARTVLQNVRLLAIGADTAEAGGDLADKAAAKTQPTATLAVSPLDAEKLTLADAKGKLRLTLRAKNDGSVATAKPVSAQSVMGVAGSSQKMLTPGPKPQPAPPLAPMISTMVKPMKDLFKPATIALEPNSIPRQNPAAEPVGKTIVVVRGTKTEEVVVPE